MARTYRRPALLLLLARLREARRFIQVLAGPRQVGKTTLARQASDAVGFPVHFASADEPTLKDGVWLAQQWEAARALPAGKPSPRHALLVLDEVQKIPAWSETVKRLWDEDTSRKLPLKVVLLGSSPLLVQKGLTESLAGRFEVIPLSHWSFPEMREAFGWTLQKYLFFGGYPGAVSLTGDEERWRRYIHDSLVETTLSRDVLLLTRVDKPALLRRLFELSCAYSGQVLSYQKMVGQLQDAGNTTTLAHYLDLLAGAGMVEGLQKYAGGKARQRGSSPKLVALNNALMSVVSPLSFAEARADRAWWGRLAETAVGAHLLNSSRGTGIQVNWWRDRGREVDYILRRGRRLTSIEVKSGARREGLSGMDAFEAAFNPQRTLLVGEGGIPLEQFLSLPASHWVE
jgi:predicted AAA+ superfamily ATPase